MKLSFSTQPGCWERHLQRQYDNPLFQHMAREITPDLIAAAQHRDEQERQSFQQNFHSLLSDVSCLAAQVEAEIMFKLQDRIDALYEQCAGLGGDFMAEKQGLRNLNEIIMQAIKASSRDKPEALAPLLEKDASRQRHFNLLNYPVIAHLLHPETPILVSDIVPTLLSEEAEAMKTAMSLFSTEQQRVLIQEGQRLLSELQQQGYTLPHAWQQLAVMESCH